MQGFAITTDNFITDSNYSYAIFKDVAAVNDWLSEYEDFQFSFDTQQVVYLGLDILSNEIETFVHSIASQEYLIIPMILNNYCSITNNTPAVFYLGKTTAPVLSQKIGSFTVIHKNTDGTSSISTFDFYLHCFNAELKEGYGLVFKGNLHPLFP